MINKHRINITSNKYANNYRLNESIKKPNSRIITAKPNEHKGISFTNNDALKRNKAESLKQRSKQIVKVDNPNFDQNYIHKYFSKKDNNYIKNFEYENNRNNQLVQNKNINKNNIDDKKSSIPNKYFSSVITNQPPVKATGIDIYRKKISGNKFNNNDNIIINKKEVVNDNYKDYNIGNNKKEVVNNNYNYYNIGNNKKEQVNYNNKNYNIRSDLNNIKGENKNKNQENLYLEKISSLEKKIEEIEKEKQNNKFLIIENQKLKQNNQNLNNNNKQLQKELYSLNENKNQYLETIKSLKEKIKEMENDNQKNDRKIIEGYERIKQENENLKNNNKQLQNQLNLLNKNKRNDQENIYQEKIKSLEETIKEMKTNKQNNHEFMVEECERLKQENQNLKNNKKQLLNELNLSNENKNKSENQENLYLKKIKSLEEEIKEMKTNKQNNDEFMVEECERLKQENQNLKNNNKQLQNEFNSLKEYKNKLVNQENLYLEKIKSLEETINEMKTNKQNNNEFITKEYEKLKQKNQMLNMSNEQLQKELNSLNVFKEKYEQEQQNNPMIRYKVPTLIGLNNIGATCFMNSTLECLSQTKDLTNYFLNKNNFNKIIKNNIALQNKNENQLSPLYLELIQNLWSMDNIKSFSPTKFINKINEMNPLFNRGEPGDSKDFIIFLLDQFHKELKINNLNISQTEDTLNQYDKENAFNHFFNKFQKDSSIISDLFFGIIETNTECLNCKNIYNEQGLNNPICYNYQSVNCLIFPLAEVYNMKIKEKQNNNIMNNKSVTLNDCFLFYLKTEHFTGDNQNFCNICGQLSDSHFTTRIYSSPNVLVIVLNRGRGNIHNIKLNFGEMIDITQFVLEKDMPELRYELYGVITHIGESGPNAHFIASCKSPIDKKWYKYNDAFVDPITNIQKEIFDYGVPYILFYQKKNN